jgi:hypothetical protein
MGYSVDANSTGCRVGHYGVLRNALSGPQHDVSARAVASHLDAFAQILMNGVEQELATCCVAATKATQVAFVRSGTYKLRKSMLLKSGGVQIVKPFCRSECYSQRLGTIK